MRIHFIRADNNLCLKHVNSEDETEPDINLAFFSIHGTKSLVFKADVKRLVFKAGVCGVKSVKSRF